MVILLSATLARAQVMVPANTEVWVLIYSGCDCQVSFGDMYSKDECEDLKKDIGDQTAPWTELTCVKELVYREKA